MSEQPFNTGEPPKLLHPASSGPVPGRVPRPSHRPPGFQQGSFRLFRVAGIDVLVHWSWFLVAYYEIQHRPAHYTSMVWNVLEYLSIFVIVLLHEFGHALACRQVGGTADRIVLWPLGGIAYVNPPARPGATLWSIAAGPLVNVVLVPVTSGLWLLGVLARWPELSPDLWQFVQEVTFINGALLVFNLLPIYPLDGGQILQSLLWFMLGRARSLNVVTVIGLVAGAGAIALAVAIQNVWVGVLAVFALWRSVIGFQASRQMLRVLQAPRRVGVNCPSCGSGPPAGSFWSCGRCQQPFDVFEQRGICPSCGAQVGELQCLDCGRRHAVLEWFAGFAHGYIVSGPAEPMST